jgi:hypothetical protein
MSVYTTFETNGSNGPIPCNYELLTNGSNVYGSFYTLDGITFIFRNGDRPSKVWCDEKKSGNNGYCLFCNYPILFSETEHTKKGGLDEEVVDVYQSTEHESPRPILAKIIIWNGKRFYYCGRPSCRPPNCGVAECTSESCLAGEIHFCFICKTRGSGHRARNCINCCEKCRGLDVTHRKTEPCPKSVAF